MKTTRRTLVGVLVTALFAMIAMLVSVAPAAASSPVAEEAPKIGCGTSFFTGGKDCPEEPEGSTEAPEIDCGTSFFTAGLECPEEPEGSTEAPEIGCGTSFFTGGKDCAKAPEIGCTTAFLPGGLHCSHRPTFGGYLPPWLRMLPPQFLPMAGISFGPRR